MKNQPLCEGLLKAHAYLRDSFLASQKERYNPPISHPCRNVVGLGIGPKIKGKEVRKDVPQALRFYVERKIHPKSQVPAEHRLPDNIGGLPTDVIETGRFRQSGTKAFDADPSRPIQPGLSCGVKFGAGDSVTGTIGAIVARDYQRFLLSSAHVLARSNGFFMGTPILVPGPADLPLLQDEVMRAQMQMQTPAQTAPMMPQASTAATFQIAALAQCVPISVDQANPMDAALAKISDWKKIDPSIYEVGALTHTKPMEPGFDMPVQKVGRATKRTKGRIVQPDICAQVDFPNGIAPFTNQILIQGDSSDAFAWEGDSGALVFTEVEYEGKPSRFAVGLLFAFSLPSRDEDSKGAARSYGLATPLSAVLTELGVELVIA